MEADATGLCALLVCCVRVTRNSKEWFVRVAEIVEDFADESIPTEVRRTIAKWADQITAWHQSHMTNGPASSR